VPGAMWQFGGGNPGRGGRARSGLRLGEIAADPETARGPEPAVGARALGRGGRWQRRQGQVAAEARSDGICYPKRERGQDR